MNENVKSSEPESSVNLEALIDYCAGKESLAQRVLESFLQISPQYLAEFTKALECGDSDELRALCHKNQGAAGIIHAESLLRLIAQIRQFAIDQEIEKAQECLPELEKAFAEINAFIKKTLSPDPAELDQSLWKI
nr:Hpt domain-containing protein [Desulfobulbaceae bacterium]